MCCARTPVCDVPLVHAIVRGTTPAHHRAVPSACTAICDAPRLRKALLSAQRRVCCTSSGLCKQCITRRHTYHPMSTTRSVPTTQAEPPTRSTAATHADVEELAHLHQPPAVNLGQLVQLVHGEAVLKRLSRDSGVGRIRRRTAVINCLRSLTSLSSQSQVC